MPYYEHCGVFYTLYMNGVRNSFFMQFYASLW